MDFVALRRKDLASAEWKFDSNESVTRNRCSPVEEMMGRGVVEFLVQIKLT